MISDILTWFEQEATLLQGIAAGTAIVGFGGAVIWGVFRFIRWAVTKPKPVQVEATVRLADDLPVLTPVQWIRTQEVMRESIIAQLDRADDKERKRLQARVDELTARINDPEGAFEAERKRLADLEDKLLREGNELGAERLNSAIAKLRAGNTDEAEAIFSEIAAREAMAVQRAARAEFGLGEIAESRVDWRAAAQHYARAAELDPSYDSLLKAGLSLMRAGQYEAALETNKRLVTLSKQDYGARDPNTATALNNYADSLRVAGQYSEAEPLCREALEIGRETLNERHPYTVIWINNLANLLRATGQYAEAESLFREALQISRETLGNLHPNVGSTLSNLAGLLGATGRYAEAEPLYREALKIDRAALGDRHPDTTITLNNLAGLLRANGRVAEAEVLFREAVEIGRETLGDRHPDVATRLNNLALLLGGAGRHIEAEPMYREALEIGRATLGDKHPGVAVRLHNLAGLLDDTERADEATPLYLEATAIFRTALGDDHPNTRTVARNTLDHLRDHAPDHPERAALEAVFGAPDAP